MLLYYLKHFITLNYFTLKTNQKTSFLKTLKVFFKNYWHPCRKFSPKLIDSKVVLQNKDKLNTKQVLIYCDVFHFLFYASSTNLVYDLLNKSLSCYNLH